VECLSVVQSSSASQFSAVPPENVYVYCCYHLTLSVVVLSQYEQLDINVDLVSLDKHTLNQIYESISSQVIHVNSGTRVLLSIHVSRHLIFSCSCYVHKGET